MLHNALVLGALLIVASLAMIVRARLGLRLYMNACAWPKVSAVIVRSALRSRNDSDGTSYSVEIMCAYEIHGIEYTTSKHTQGLSIEEPEVTERTLALTYPGGKAVAVSVSPSNPAVAVLNTGYPEDMKPLQNFGYFCALAGAASVVFGVAGTLWN